MDKAQREIDAAEWDDRSNWAGIGPFKAYFSKRDSRVFVPLLNKEGWPWIGSTTINFGHRRGMLYAVVILLVLIAMVAVITGG